MTSLFPIAYLPPIPYVAACMKSELVMLEKHEHFIKQTIRNRTVILTANGILPLVIPVQHHDLFRIPIHEVKISYDTPWQKVHWKSIVSAYRNSPFFEYYEDDFAPFYEGKTGTLYEFNLGLINTVFRLLGIDFTPTFSVEYHKDAPHITDFRNSFSKKIILEQERRTSENRYRQVFSGIIDFVPGLSVLDLLFNEGPESAVYLSRNHQ